MERVETEGAMPQLPDTLRIGLGISQGWFQNVQLDHFMAARGFVAPLNPGRVDTSRLDQILHGSTCSRLCSFHGALVLSID